MIDRRLQPVSFSEFVRLCEVTECQLHLRRPANLKADHGLVGRIRGAWGNELFRRSGGAKGAFACFLDEENSQSKPFCILTDDEDDIVIVRLRLFGAADRYRQDAFDSLIFALTNGDGLDLGLAKRVRRPLELLRMSWTKQVGMEVTAPLDSAVLHFATPLCLRSTGGALHLDYHKLWGSLYRRMIALASWHGLEISDEAFLETAISVRYNDSDLQPCLPWERWSKRTRSKRMMRGVLGKLHMENLTDPLFNLLCFGEITLVGSDCTFGLGRYSLARAKVR